MSGAGGEAFGSQDDAVKVLHYLGPPGTYSHQVALELLPNLQKRALGKILLQPCGTIKSTLEEASKRTEETSLPSWSLLPYENNSNGPVIDSYDILFALDSSMPIKIIADYHLPVNHSLMCTRLVHEQLKGREAGEVDLKKLDVVSSHSQVSVLYATTLDGK